ncbi:MAG: hypothetical protein ACLQB1_14925 [Streptosporangiaceae bacterium]
MARYPVELEQPGLLRDGRSVMIRPVLAADEEAMLDFSRRLSRRTLAQRLLGPAPRLVTARVVRIPRPVNQQASRLRTQILSHSRA